MKTLSYTESRARYAEVLDGVINDREEVIITRAGHEPVVIVSLEDFESLRETAYLMRSPANARRLLDAMERLESGFGESHDLLDADWSMRLVWDINAWEDHLWWQAQDHKVLKRINLVIQDVLRNGNEGIGKLGGCPGSRRT
jgi:antitoxin YefM